jgi:hypothetical protein
MTKIRIILCSLVILLTSGQAFAQRIQSQVPGGGCTNSTTLINGIYRLRSLPCNKADQYYIGPATATGQSMCRYIRYSVPVCIGSCPGLEPVDVYWQCLVPAKPGVMGSAIMKTERVTFDFNPPASPAVWRIGSNYIHTNWGGFWTRDYSDAIVRLRPWAGAVNQLWNRIP